jgi:hypothetical protein
VATALTARVPEGATVLQHFAAPCAAQLCHSGAPEMHADHACDVAAGGGPRRSPLWACTFLWQPRRSAAMLHVVLRLRMHARTGAAR